MIRVFKPAQIPAVLTDKAQAKRNEHETEFLADRAAFESGDQTFEFDSAIYGSPEVRKALADAQHHKCCFCETKIETGDVEHFRPKAAYRQARNEPLQRPGYYWLAYAWSNLYLACAQCNQRNKENLFPLRDPSTRVASHEQAAALDGEEPMFLDPGVDDPELFIEFRENQPYARKGHPRGHSTILALELGRWFLMERRLERYHLVETILDALEVARASHRRSPELRGMSAALARWTRAESDYTSMTRCTIRARWGEDLRMPLEAEALLAHVGGVPLPRIEGLRLDPD